MQKAETVWSKYNTQSHYIALCAYYRVHAIKISRYLIVLNFCENSAQLILTLKENEPSKTLYYLRPHLSFKKVLFFKFFVIFFNAAVVCDRKPVLPFELNPQLPSKYVFPFHFLSVTPILENVSWAPVKKFQRRVTAFRQVYDTTHIEFVGVKNGNPFCQYHVLTSFLL